MRNTFGKILFLAVVFCACNCFSGHIDIVNGVWAVSKNMTKNQEIGGKLREIEAVARQDTDKAAELCKELKESLDDPEIYTDDGEYLPLVLDSMWLYYAAHKGLQGKAVLTEAQRLIEEYAEKAEGQRYCAYKYLYHRIRGYYYGKKDNKSMIKAQKDMILYDPADYSQIMTLMDQIRDLPEAAGDLDAFLSEFKERQGVVEPEFELTLILASKKKSNSEKIKGACAWLEKQSGGAPEVIMRALPRITKFVSAKDKEALTDYYYALTDLALRQSSTEDRLTVFAMALNERQKLVAAVPEILPPKGEGN